MGGFDGKVRLNSGEVFRADEGRWANIAPMAERRVWTGAAVKNDKVSLHFRLVKNFDSFRYTSLADSMVKPGCVALNAMSHVQVRFLIIVIAQLILLQIRGSILPTWRCR